MSLASVSFFAFVWMYQGRPGEGGGGWVVVYQYTRKKFAKIPKNTQNSSKYTQN